MISMVGILVASLSVVAVLVERTVMSILLHFEIIQGTVPELLVDFVIYFLVASLMVTLLGKIPLKPVHLLIEKMNQLTSGDYNARIELKQQGKQYKELQKLSESFNALAEELSNTEMLRADFINNFSHEFKTPIVSIAGFAKLLKKGNLTEEQRKEYLDIIEEESLRLSKMATNVLNLSKVENQSILTEVTTFNLSEQLRRCVLLEERKWIKKELNLQMNFEEHEVTANEELLKLIWINLIDNGIKFSQEGGTLSIDIFDRGECLEVSIANKGEEIPETQRKKIFDKFYQVDESHAQEGNGIGLALVKHIVELHRGEVSVDCKDGITTFYVKIPKSFVSV